MATAKHKARKTANAAGQLPKMSIAETREALVQAYKELNLYKEQGYCYMCDTHKNKDKFYMSTDPRIKSGITPICKECARKIARRVDKNGEEHEPTKESVCMALKYLNKPYINNVWDSSVQESENTITDKAKNTPWEAYIKNIAMKQWIGLTYFDSDFFKEKVFYEDEKDKLDQYTLNQMPKDAVEDYEKNKKDTKRLLGYDPFEHEALSDQPFLYSQLIGLIDTGGDENEDMMRNASCVSIVRGFLQADKIDNAMARLMGDISKIDSNAGAIKSLQESKAKVMTTITSLAAENCISLKNNKNSKKGENTWTGKIKKIKDLALRGSEVNGFDINTCRGMRQVQEISDASIMKQLQLDESEWADMVAEMRVVNTQLRQERDAYKEINRIILKENLDLKDTITESGVDIKSDLVDLKDLYSIFGDDDINNDDSEVSIEEEPEEESYEETSEEIENKDKEDSIFGF